jgi:Lar family restriction alleviation protein
MEDDALLPCPFCGEDAEYETTTDPKESCNCVMCPDCDYSLMTGPVGIGWYGTKKEAAAAWNRRSA